MSNNLQNEDHEACDAKHLVRTFMSLYGTWKKRPPTSNLKLESLVEIFHRDCENCGF